MSGQPDEPSPGTHDVVEASHETLRMDEGTDRRRWWFKPCESEADLNTRVRETLDFILLSQRAGTLVQGDLQG